MSDQEQQNRESAVSRRQFFGAATKGVRWSRLSVFPLRKRKNHRQPQAIIVRLRM